jgi:pilus assembly protein CpaF
VNDGGAWPGGLGSRPGPSHQPAAAELRIRESYQAAKFAVFEAMLQQLEERGQVAETLGPKLLRTGIERAIARFNFGEGLALNAQERALLVEDVEDEIIGFGPLEPLLRDPDIDDIIINGPSRIYAERGGRLTTVSARFRDDTHLMNVIQRIVSPIGRRVDEATPYVDARLPDGSRVNIVIPPVALDGPMVSIRKFKRQQMNAQDFVRSEAMSADMLHFLSDAIQSRLNILVCGGTGSGKTTLLNMLSAFIDDGERLITIEDAAELQLRQSHVVRLETRPANLEGAREVTARELVRNALRMRPDRIILGEVRGAEAIEMLQAMSTGHDGSMATIHANSARDAFGRLEMLLGFGGMAGDPHTLRRYIASSIHVVIHLSRLANGQRRVMSVAEVTGIEGDSYSLNELFRFEEQPPLSGRGAFATLSQRPFFSHRLKHGQLSAAPSVQLRAAI